MAGQLTNTGQKTLGIFPGSFNPWHAGHEDVLIKAIGLTDQLIVAQLQNSSKPAAEPIPQSTIDSWSGAFGVTFIRKTDSLLVDLAADLGATHIIRGIRFGNLTEELELALVTEELSKGRLITILLPASREHIVTSSTVRRDLSRFGRS